MTSLHTRAFNTRTTCLIATVCALLLTLLPWQSTYADTASSAASVIQQRLDQLDANDTSPTTRTLRDLYQQTLTTLSSIDKLQSQVDSLNKQIESLPQRLSAQRKTLDAPVSVPDKPDLKHSSLGDLEQLVTVRKAELVQLEQQRDQLSQKIDNNDAQLISLREKLAELKQSSPEAITTPADGTPDTADAATQLQGVRNHERALRIQSLELQLLALPGESELDQLQLAQIKREIDARSAQLTSLQDALQLRRRIDVETTLSELQPVPDAASLPPKLAEASQVNQQYSAQLRDLLVKIDSATHEQRGLKQQLDQISQSYKLIQQQLELEIQQLSGDLRSFTRQLTRPLATDTTRAEINRQRLLNLNLNREQLTTQQELTRGAETTPKLSDADQKRYEEILHNRVQLLERLRQSRQQLINEESQILSIQEQINEQLRQARTLIDQQLLWMPTVPPLNGQWLQNLRDGLEQLQQEWQQNAGTAPILRADTKPVLMFGLPSLLLVLSVLISRYLRRHRQRWCREIGKVTQDKISRSLRLLIGAPLIALPVPLFLLLLARQGLAPANPWQPTLSTLLYLSALSLFVYHCFQLWLTSADGLFQGHLGVPAQLSKVLRRELHVLFWTGLPLLSGLLICDSLDEVTLLASGGRALFLLLILVLLRFWWVLWHVNREFNRLTLHQHWWSDSRLWIGAMLAFNLVMVLLGIAGYLLSALFLMLILTVLILQVTLVFMLYRLGLRWLLVEERRLAFKQARERRAEQIAAREKQEEDLPLKEDYIDLQTISEQTQLLLKVACVVLLVLTIWLTLGDFLPTLHILESVQVWSTLQATSDGEVVHAVTLSDLLLGLLTLGISLMAAYNLPGVLELLVLRHLQLTPGSNYAITTLLKYTLILIGLISGVSQFGLEWSKLQWLIAALGVGLGFGLQEIVANFVSGLILLFEKPIRIGDTVTIGGITGSVSRIQIRATTIVDWDRKEVVIPNKTFITEQLTNWSLTDPITRVVLKVGVAYGSDTDLALKLLIQVAAENPSVLKDPEPSAYFQAFADSTLNLELRVFVNTITDLLPVTSALNRAIDRAFKAHNIEIAFPQLDVHLRRDEKK